MTVDASRKQVLAWAGGAVALLMVANLIVAVRWVGTRAGEIYVWVCRRSGAELSYNPSVFGGPGRARLQPGAGHGGVGHHWELVAPKRPDPRLPWNWLALLLDRPPTPRRSCGRSGSALTDLDISAE
jgi:hypothetical protein